MIWCQMHGLYQPLHASQSQAIGALAYLVEAPLIHPHIQTCLLSSHDARFGTHE